MEGNWTGQLSTDSTGKSGGPAGSRRRTYGAHPRSQVGEHIADANAVQGFELASAYLAGASLRGGLSN